jgi:hypothetical protein
MKWTTNPHGPAGGKNKVCHGIILPVKGKGQRNVYVAFDERDAPGTITVRWSRVIKRKRHYSFAYISSETACATAIVLLNLLATRNADLKQGLLEAGFPPTV